LRWIPHDADHDTIVAMIGNKQGVDGEAAAAAAAEEEELEGATDETVLHKTDTDGGVEKTKATPEGWFEGV
jgi:hypothetical protein